MKFEDPTISFLALISFFKEEMPWVYEIGLETYRGLKSAKTKIEKGKLIENFERVLEMVGHPMFREVYGKSDDLYVLSKELRMFTHRLLTRLA